MNIGAIQELVDNDGIVFLSYGGFLSQTLISGMTEALELEAQEHGITMSVSNNLFTIFIELSQNMMNYSKSLTDDLSRAQGLIIVSKDKEFNYYIHSQNIVSGADKEKIEPKLLEIQSLDKDGIKKRYRELRKSGQHTHGRGGGIGFYEIAKKCDAINFNFTKIQEDRYYFHVKTTISTQKGKK